MSGVSKEQPLTGEGWGEGVKEVFSMDYIPLPVQPRTWVTYVPDSDSPQSPPTRGGEDVFSAEA